MGQECAVYFICCRTAQTDRIGQGYQERQEGLPKAAEGCFGEMDSTPSIQHHTGTNVRVSSGSQIWDASCKGTEHTVTEASLGFEHKMHYKMLKSH